MRIKEIKYRPIGIIHSPFMQINGMPIQPSGARGIKGTIEIKKPFTSGLKDLDGFSHIILIYHFHLTKGFSLKVIPFLDKVSRGLFSTRVHMRPNPIGISVVRLLKVKDSRLFVENIDIIDGTPLLDIKPYVSKFDNAVREKTGWLTKTAHKSKRTRSDERFK